MRILAIETSCDETAIAVVETKGPRKRPAFRVRAHIISSQVSVHAPYGGVVPMLAKREHEKNLVPALTRAFKAAKLLKKITKTTKNAKRIATHAEVLAELFAHEPELLASIAKFLGSYEFPKIDLIAVTIGPGLEPALWAGVNFVRAFALLFDIPIVGANHMEGHLYSTWFHPEMQKSSAFPRLALLVSGGHTELVLMRQEHTFERIGETRDDAAGEAFDKVAKMLGLTYPGGPEIERLARAGNPDAFKFPRPMVHFKNFDFSFSGLKTAVLYELRKHKTKTTKLKSDIAASFQAAVIDTLVTKTIRAAQQYNVKSILVGGGVIANKALEKSLENAVASELKGVRLYVPISARGRSRMELITDNALMIAISGYMSYIHGGAMPWQKIEPDSNLNVGDSL